MLLIFNSFFLTYQFFIFKGCDVKLCFYWIIISKSWHQGLSNWFFWSLKETCFHDLTRRFEMQLSQSLNLKQKQSLVMTPQLQQAIKLLQLTNLELKQFLEEQTLIILLSMSKKKLRHQKKMTQKFAYKIKMTPIVSKF